MEYAPISWDNHNVKFWTARRSCALSAGWFTSGTDSLCKNTSITINEIFKLPWQEGSKWMRKI